MQSRPQGATRGPAAAYAAPMARGEPTSQRGAVMHLATTGKVQPVAGAVCALLGVCLGVYIQRLGAATNDPRFLGLAAAGLVGFGAWLAARRTSVELDRDAMTVTARWRWLFLHGEETVSARGQKLYVERAARASKDSDVDTFDVVLAGLRLRKVTEIEGGAEEAEAFARRVASHLDVAYGGRRDSDARRRADERQRKAAKYALVPLLIVAVAMMLMFAYMTLLGPVG